MNPPKMPLHIGDYRRDTGHLRAAEHGAYLLLLMHYWSTGGLPVDDVRLATIACMSKAEWTRARPTLELLFKPGWKKPRIDDDLASAKAAYERRAMAGEKGGKAKALLGQKASNATALPEQPLTLNLEPEERKNAADAAPKLQLVPELPPYTPEELERQLFDRGKKVLGANAGGVIAKLKAVKNGSTELARAAIEIASTKQNPREYINRIIRNQEPSSYVDPRL